MDTAPLFESLQVGKKELRNRIVAPPMVTVRGIVTPEGIEWYRGLAAGGASLVIVEATGVDGFGNALTVENLKPLVDAIHGGGALAAIQLFPVAFGRSVAPNDLSTAEIDEIVENYGTAARVCRDAGFDGVEPHGAHGFLLNQFFSPAQNTRGDEYAGSLENHMRLALRVVEALRGAAGVEMMILYRHTPVGAGYDINDSLALAEKLVGAGVDVLDISPASDQAPGDRAAQFMKLGVPVIAVNKLDEVDRALEVLSEGRAEWPNKVREGREGREDEVVACTRCDELCFGNLRKGIAVACTQWV